MKKLTGSILALLAVIVVITAGLVLTFFFASSSVYIIIGLTVILGVAVLILMLFLMAVGFSSLNLTDAKEALGLPKGSVRAMIALLLIVIWVIASLFLFYYVGFETNPQVTQAGGELAQTIYTTIATLVVAISAFYFGSKNVAAAAAATGTLSLPKVTSIDPQNVTLGQTDQAGTLFTITGANFRSPQSVRFVRDAQGKSSEITATDIMSNDTKITCKIIITSNQIAGEWDLVVVNSDGGEGRMANAFITNP